MAITVPKHYGVMKIKVGNICKHLPVLCTVLKIWSMDSKGTDSLLQSHKKLSTEREKNLAVESNNKKTGAYFYVSFYVIFLVLNFYCILQKH